jgi:hypothetical protein
VISFQLNLSHQVEVVDQSICVARRSLQVDLYKRTLVIMLSHIKNMKVVNYRASSFDVYISAESKEPSYFLQVLCVLTLVWSVTLQWYFMGPSFWRNPVAVYKVHCLFPNGLWLIHKFAANCLCFKSLDIIGFWALLEHLG